MVPENIIPRNILTRNILIRCPHWIGDHIMAEGFYRNLRGAYPTSRITWLIRDSMKDLTLGALADEYLMLPEGARKWGREMWSFARELRAKHFDLSITLPASISSALLFFLSGIPERTGFSSDGSEIFLTSHLGWRGIGSGLHKSKLYDSLFEFVSGTKALDVWPGRVPLRKEKKILIAPGASIALRVWPYFYELLGALLREARQYQFVFVGAEESQSWHERLKAFDPQRVKDLIGRTTLTELIRECESAELVLANDSGVAHIAATLAGSQTIVLFGPGDPNYIAPRGNVLPIRNSELPCSPCEKPRCHARFGYQTCLKSLSFDSVLAEVVLPKLTAIAGLK